ncbi:MAG: GyrI-like domain-containing protein [Bacteroidetes bacterium]|nr:GyrI-like domain-containing protein [Bacteroidota bacterium]
MFLRTETHPETLLIGQHLKMSLAENRTPELWKAFMPRRREIKMPLNDTLYSLEIYPSDYYAVFDLHREFEKWAAVPVDKSSQIPPGFQPLLLPQGLYAVFLHKGPASEGEKTYRFIHETWLPKSNYKLDDRPHLAIMDERYKGEHPDSEEEIWIPIV